MSDVKSAARVLDLLELFSCVQGDLGVSDVARRLAIPKSSAQGLLATLASRGYLQRSGSAYLLPEPLKNGQWIGGPRARLLRLAQPLMDQMAKESGESAFLGVMSERLDIQYIAKAISSNELRYDASLEHRRPAHTTSIGVALLSQMGDQAVEDFLTNARLDRVTERTTTDKKAFRALVERARRAGFAELRDTNQAGISGVSAPVFGPNGEVIAGLNLGGPSWRFPKVRPTLVRLVVRNAADLSAKLGNGHHA
jgi:IclR family pca regulon transcriptional regulator